MQPDRKNAPATGKSQPLVVKEEAPERRRTPMCRSLRPSMPTMVEDGNADSYGLADGRSSQHYSRLQSAFLAMAEQGSKSGNNTWF